MGVVCGFVITLWGGQGAHWPSLVSWGPVPATGLTVPFAEAPPLCFCHRVNVSTNNTPSSVCSFSVFM